MDKITANDPASKSADLLAANIAKLKELFPEVVAEGKVDFAALQEILGEEVETGEEYYRFTWAGKAQARREAHKPSTGTLRPAPEESVDWDKTKNLYIEGDNLEVLKLLQKSYGGKVKMIYIDPPYNTGKDFVYKDNYRDNLRNYKEQTGQVDSEGNTLSTKNTDTDGRYHSNWLNMIYPRLRLAKNLLSADGVVFISIDDNEQDNLKKLCNEVYGEDNLVATIACINKPSGRSDDKYVATAHEYILIYRKSSSFLIGEFDAEEHITRRYSKVDTTDSGAGRMYREEDLRKRGSHDERTDRPNLFYPFFFSETAGDFYAGDNSDETPKGYVRIEPMKTADIQGTWRWGKDTATSMLKYLHPRYMPNKEQWSVFEWEYLDERSGVKPTSHWNFKDVNSERGSESFGELGFSTKVFQNPKPVGTIKRTLILATRSNDLILDFFSGSGTTAHAVMQLNAEDGGQRQHIQVQLPEPTDAKSEAHKAGYATIAEIGKERIRRAGKKIVSELEAAIKALEAKAVRTEEEEQELKDKQERLAKLDIGFRVFKLDSSNINAWDGDPERMQENLLSAAENIKPDRTEADVLYEVLLKYGLDLTLPIEERTIAKRKVYNVGMGALFLCLAETITNAVAEGIGQWKEELQPETCRVIFRDNGFTDVEKTNAVQTLKRFGVTEVRSV